MDTATFLEDKKRLEKEYENFVQRYEAKGGDKNRPPSPGKTFYFDSIDYEWKQFRFIEK